MPSVSTPFLARDERLNYNDLLVCSICGREQEARDERIKLLREGHISVEDLPRDEGGR